MQIQPPIINIFEKAVIHLRDHLVVVVALPCPEGVGADLGIALTAGIAGLCGARRDAGVVDDALGESYDKIAKLLDLGFPGGPQIETFAKKGHPLFNLSKPLLNSNDCNFSFSGLKTSTIRTVELEKNKKKNFKYDICASFQHAVYKILKTKCKNAFHIFKKNYPNKNNFVVVGGVASNNFIRKKIKKLAKSFKFNLIIPKKILCTDNAAMIAWTAIEKYKFIQKNNFHFQPLPQWSI